MNWIKPDWPAPANVHAATTLRTGGASDGAFASLNPAAHVNDNPEHVEENRRRIETMLQLPSEPVWLQQVHGSRAVKADGVKTPMQADASYTGRSGFVCAVLTADCLPILFAANDGSEIAAAHAGWRGLEAGIIESTVDALKSRDILVWLGPAIGPECFEVGGEVRQAFLQNSTEFVAAFREHDENKWLADIYQLARIILFKKGKEQVYGGGFCTVTDAERFYSYRRDGETGRMATLIWRD